MSETDIERARREREEREENSPHKIRRWWCNACGKGKSWTPGVAGSTPADTLVVVVCPVAADETRLECDACGAFNSGTDDPPEIDPADDGFTAAEIASVAADLDQLEAEELAVARRPKLTLIPMPDD
jgi:hypothetical protein